MKETRATEHPTSHAADAPAVLAPLRRRVQAWIDSDRILPADGAALLAALDRLQAALASEDAPAVQAGVERFVGQVQMLIEVRGLAAEEGRQPLEMAMTMLAWLPAAPSTGEERGKL
jgi:hypothetical protein